jgi:hypothetical protein
LAAIAHPPAVDEESADGLATDGRDGKERHTQQGNSEGLGEHQERAPCPADQIPPRDAALSNGRQRSGHAEAPRAPHEHGDGEHHEPRDERDECGQEAIAKLSAECTVDPRLDRDQHAHDYCHDDRDRDGNGRPVTLGRCTHASPLSDSNRRPPLYKSGALAN